LAEAVILLFGTAEHVAVPWLDLIIQELI
jgi:hypothetical protein